MQPIAIRGARVHNLKGVDCDLPRNSLVVITGPSGSGKSSLAFDTLYAEGQRRYVESLSAYARQFLDQLEKPDVDSVTGLSPAIAIEQRTHVEPPAFHGGNGHRDLRPPSRALRGRRPPALPEVRRAGRRAQAAEQIADAILRHAPGKPRCRCWLRSRAGGRARFGKELEELAARVPPRRAWTAAPSTSTRRCPWTPAATTASRCWSTG